MMSSLVIKEGKNTPLINFDLQKNHFLIQGRSYPENAKKFYKPVLDWLSQCDVKNKSLKVEFRLFYISSSSIISMLEMIKKFDSLKKQNSLISISWYYESDDDDLLKIGEDYKKVSSLDFELIPTT